jgi:ribonuclease R
VRLKETGAEGIIPIRSIGAEYFRHDERAHALVGERTGTKYVLGDRLVVRLLKAAPLTGGLRFALAEGESSMFARERTNSRARRLRDR